MTQPPNGQLSNQQLDDDAIAWVVRLKDPLASADDRDRFRQWLARSPRHQQAYAQALALWEDSEAPARALGRGNWYRHPARRPTQGWRWRLAPVAALACAALALLLWRDPGLMQRWNADLASPPGQTRAVALADGSTLVLDGDSAVDVRLTDGTRQVRMRRGRAWFAVARAEIPFVVHTPGAEIRVLGTAFSVADADGATQVLVERGRVEVTAAGARAGAVLTAGQGIVVGAAIPPAQPAAFEPSTALAWRRGLVVFDRATLAEVAATIEKLRPGRVIVLDEHLRRKTLSGVFDAGNPQAILGALQSGLGVKVTTVPAIATVIRP